MALMPCKSTMIRRLANSPDFSNCCIAATSRSQIKNTLPTPHPNRIPERIVIHMLAQSGPHGIADNVPRCVLYIFFSTQHAIKISWLPNRISRCAYSRVYFPCRVAFEGTHQRIQRRLFSQLHQPVNMIRHGNECKAFYVPSFVQKTHAVNDNSADKQIAEDGLATIGGSAKMVDTAWLRDSALAQRAAMKDYDWRWDFHEIFVTNRIGNENSKCRKTSVRGVHCGSGLQPRLGVAHKLENGASKVDFGAILRYNNLK